MAGTMAGTLTGELTQQLGGVRAGIFGEFDLKNPRNDMLNSKDDTAESFSAIASSDSWVKVPPWQCEVGFRASAGRLAPLAGSVLPPERPSQTAPGHGLGCASQPHPKPPISPPLTTQVRCDEAFSQRRIGLHVAAPIPCEN